MKGLYANLGESKLYFSTAIEPQMKEATIEANDGFSASGFRHGTCAFVNLRQP
jgi:folate-dependent tRNA-U54 methylase TrmFO/GidA